MPMIKAQLPTLDPSTRELKFIKVSVFQGCYLLIDPNISAQTNSKNYLISIKSYSQDPEANDCKDIRFVQFQNRFI